MISVEPRTRNEHEKRELLAQLEPYAAIATPADAPAGSHLKALFDVARAADDERAALAARGANLRSRLETARTQVAFADAADDIPALAVSTAEAQVLAERLAGVEPQLMTAERAATETPG